MQLSVALPYFMAVCIGGGLGVPLSHIAKQLPKRLEHRWRKDAWRTLGVDTTDAGITPQTASQTACRHPQGDSNHSRQGQPREVGYPKVLISLASGVLGLLTMMVYGASLQGVLIFSACIALLVLALIDLRSYLLPDAITLPLLWMGFAYQLAVQPSALSGAVLGAMAGYLMLWGLYWCFKLCTGKDAMGYGDFKMLAAICAWVGVSMLPMLMMISAIAGLVVSVAFKLRGGDRQSKAIPFGPYLAVAGWACMLAGDRLLALTPSPMY